MRGTSTAVWTLVVCLAAATAQAGEASFSAKPSVTKTGAGAKIAFAAAAPTDCEVAVLSADGKVIRHLAAGVLGDKAPEPLKPGLAQELVWDGKDDQGRPAVSSVASGGGGFKVRVRLGTKPVLDKVIGHNPAATGAIVALATHPASGELHVFHLAGSLHPDDASTTCSVYSRDGKYLRTILPWPASLPEEKLKGLKRVKLADGRTVPFFYQAETRSLLPGAGNLVVNGPVVTPDGRLIFTGHQEWCSTATRYNIPGIKQILTINAADGSIPEGGPLGPVLAKGSQCSPGLAASPDGKTFYAAGVGSGYADKMSGHHAVHRFALGDAESKPFIGSAAEPGAGPDRLNAPEDVAVDKDGNLYVADRGNDRIAVFKPDGGFLGEVKVEKPKLVKVNPKTGAIYVLLGSATTNDLWKFASWKDAAPAARMELRRFRYPRAMCMALDASADPPVLWVASPGSSYAVPPFKLLRIADQGASFGEAVDAGRAEAAAGESVGPVMLLSYDRVRDRLFVNRRVYDVASGTFSAGPGRGGGAKEGMGGFGLDGNLYLMSYPKTLARWGPDFKLLPFGDGAGAGAGKGGTLQGPENTGSLRLRSRGVTADPAGNIYAFWQFSDKTADGHGDPNWLTLHAPDGAVRNLKLIDSGTRGVASPRLDAAGNIYITLGARPKGLDVPEEFAGQDLGKPWKSRGFNTNDIDWYHLMYGCIVKFPPEGGVIRKGSGGVPMGFSYGLETEVQGAKWIHYGASPVPSWRQKYPDTCLCEAAQFDVDGFGRSFFPDAGRFRVGMLDTGGNLIGTFGGYGNADSAGPKSLVPAPDIPMLWPDNIAVGKGTVYVGDRLNKRVLAVRLDCAAEETVPLP